MRVLSTKLPLQNDVTEEQVLDVVFRWLKNSSYYADIASQLDKYERQKSFTVSSRYCRMELLKTSFENVDYLVVHVEHKYYDKTWTTDILYQEVGCQKSLIVYLDCFSAMEIRIVPSECRTEILQYLIDSGLLQEDGIVPITDKPIFADESLLDILVQAIRGNYRLTLPMIYVSRVSGCIGYEVDIERLAKSLRGVAHVLGEPSQEYSYQLKEQTGGGNVYNGYIGIYVPNMIPKLIRADRNSFENRTERAITISVCEMYTAQIDAQAPSWNILNTQAFAQEAKEKSELLNAYDVENTNLEEKVKRLQDKVASLTSENGKLSAQCQGYKEVFNSSGRFNGLLVPSELEEFFEYEQYDLIVTALKDRFDSLDPSSRSYELLESILAANPLKGNGIEMLESLKSVFIDGAQIKIRDYTLLRQYGFDLISDNGHQKLVYKGQAKYQFIVSNSSSDVRSGKNMISEITNKLSVYKKR